MGRNRELVRDVERVLDCWFDEGATLRTLMDKTAWQVDVFMAKIEGSKRQPWFAVEWTGKLHDFMRGMEQIDLYWRVDGLEGLLQDHNLFSNLVVKEGGAYPSPRDYLEEYMEAHEQPAKETCRAFLELHGYSEESIELWVDGIAWDEDEEGDNE